MVSLSTLSSTRSRRIGLAVLAILALATTAADARTGSGANAGSRGGRTFSAPPATNTAPKAAPIERSVTQPAARPSSPSAAAARPAATASRFGGGFGSMLMGGLIGAGLFGLLSGHGLFGGMMGMASVFGLLLQVALIGGVIWLAMSFFRSRRPGLASAAGPTGMMRTAAASGSGMGSSMYGASASASASPPLALEKTDFDAFEQLLSRIQNAYGREDQPALRAMTTQEMMAIFADDLAENARKGLLNLVSDAKLLQGDLSESWREQDAEYATVAMRFELLDTMVDRKTGRIISGDANVPEQVTELWTFTRRLGSAAGAWKLSAIQQAN